MPWQELAALYALRSATQGRVSWATCWRAEKVWLMKQVEKRRVDIIPPKRREGERTEEAEGCKQCAVPSESFTLSGCELREV
jgi:hypothetical protein